MEQILVFELGGEAYGIDIRHVQEVVSDAVLQSIPLAPPVLLGAFNFHGGIVPVLDLAQWFGLEAHGRDARVIVLAEEGLQLALAVTRLRRILSIAAEQLLPPPPRDAGGSGLRALVHSQGDVIHLLDARTLVESLDRLATVGGERTRTAF